MYLYQDFLRLGERQADERGKQDLREDRKRIEKNGGENLRFDVSHQQECHLSPKKMSSPLKRSFDVKAGIPVDGGCLLESSPIGNKTFQSDTSMVLDSFNPMCSICNSKMCTSAFNPKFKTCLHQAKT